MLVYQEARAKTWSYLAVTPADSHSSENIGPSGPTGSRLLFAAAPSQLFDDDSSLQLRRVGGGLIVIATPPSTDAIDGRMAPNAPSFPATASPSLVAIVTTTVVVFGDVDSDGREGEGEGEEITNVCSTIIVEEVAAAPELRPSIKARVPTAHSNPCQRMFAQHCA